jgi:hypothetical protein
VIDESNRQLEKQNEQRSSTLRGITIDRSNEDTNAFDSIRFNLESDSHVIDESELHREKQKEPIISTE